MASFDGLQKGGSLGSLQRFLADGAFAVVHQAQKLPLVPLKIQRFVINGISSNIGIHLHNGRCNFPMPSMCQPDTAGMTGVFTANEGTG